MNGRPRTGGKHPEKNTSRLHEYLLDAVRSDAMAAMRNLWPNRYGGPEFTMIPEGSPFVYLLPWSPYMYRPDVTAWFEHDGRRELIAIEIGKIHQRGQCPIIHVSLYGGVAILDANESEFEQHILHEVRAAVDEAMTKWGA